VIENEEGFLRESRRDWEKLGGGASCARRGNGGSGGGSGSDESCGSCGGSGSDENKKSEPFWGLTLYSNNEKRLNFF